MPDYQPNVVLSNQEFNVVGTNPIRHDGMDKVTGRARYGVDTDIPGMLFGKILNGGPSADVSDEVLQCPLQIDLKGGRPKFGKGKIERSVDSG